MLIMTEQSCAGVLCLHLIHSGISLATYANNQQLFKILMTVYFDLSTVNTVIINDNFPETASLTSRRSTVKT